MHEKSADVVRASKDRMFHLQPILVQIYAVFELSLVSVPFWFPLKAIAIQGQRADAFRCTSTALA